MKKYRNFLYWISAVVIIGFAAFFFYRNADQWDQLREAMSKYRRRELLLAFLAVSFQLFCQSLRMWALIPDRKRADIARAIQALVFGQAVNAFVPARAGDAVKAVKLSAGGRTIPTSVGILLADKLIDLISFLVMCAAASPFWLKSLPVPSLMPKGNTWIYIVVGVVALFGVPWLFPGLRKKLLKLIRGFGSGLTSLKKPLPAIQSLLFSWGGWAGELTCLIVLSHSLDVPVTVTDLIWVLAVLNVGIAVPVAVANLGAFEGSMVLAFKALSIAAPTALAIAAMHHVIQVATILFWTGVLAIFRKKVQKSGGMKS